MMISEEVNILSLFDGKSCGRVAATRSKLPIGKYYASEINKYAMFIAQKNFPDTIQLGRVEQVNAIDIPDRIDLLLGGSPCQSFSFVGHKKGMSTKDEIEILALDHYLDLKKQGYEFEGQSYLFWEFLRVLQEIRLYNPNVKFLLENVYMDYKWEMVISRALGVPAIKLNSSIFSAQNRPRLYWTNIGMKPAGLFGDLESIIKFPEDKGLLLRDVLEDNVDPKYYLSQKMIDSFTAHEERHKAKGTGFYWKPTTGLVKAACLRANGAICCTDNLVFDKISDDHSIGIRRLTPIECERLQTLPDNYTEGVSDTQRYIMIGNGWTIDSIAHILSYYE